VRTRALAVAGLLALGCGPTDPGRGQPSPAFLRARAQAAPAAREWRSYLHDPGRSHFSPLETLHPGNVERLRVAWTYDAGDASPRGASQIQCNPIVVRGVLYATSPSLRLFALDAASGQELWSFDVARVSRAGLNTNRGVSYWADGEDERILYAAGSQLFAVDARSGRAIRSFGDDGQVDLAEGLGPDRARDFVVATSPGAVYRDLLILGSRVSELANAAPGHVRAYDVRSGAIRWIFRTIPRSDEAGAETWPESAAERFGGANAWAGLSVDAERGLVFVPTGSAAYDFYGGDRPGDNLFANSLLALDAATGERRWHFQVVHHDVWDRDLPAPPNLVTLDRDGARLPAVAQVTKTGHVFVFDRQSGAPLHPIREVPVPGDGVPGEALSPSQPLPLRPPPFVRQHLTPESVTRRTPEARAAVLETLRHMRNDGPFTPPSLAGSVVQPGMDGGAEWGGAAFDARSGRLYVNANDVPYALRMLPTPRIRGPGSLGRAAYVLGCAPCHGVDRAGVGISPPLTGLRGRLGPLATWRVIRDGRGRMPGSPFMRQAELALLLYYLYFPGDSSAGSEPLPADAPPQLGLFPRYIHAGWAKFSDPEGFPASAPPWGTLTAIDLNRGVIDWQPPAGCSSSPPRPTLDCERSTWRAGGSSGRPSCPPRASPRRPSTRRPGARSW
jgi:quinoprotein glucose dehydrogenase